MRETIAPKGSFGQLFRVLPMNSICVIGLGYIGLPTASLFANNGFQVLGVDSNPAVAGAINSGKNHIDEVGLRTLVEAAVGSGRLRAATVPQKADAFIIAVPTPVTPDKQPDLSHVFDAVRSILPHLQRGTLVVVESTVPPGTTRKIATFIAESRKDLANGANDNPVQVMLAHCPERVLPGKILTELVENDRVVGGLTAEASAIAASLYRNIVSGKIYETDATTAEMVKLSENTFRDVNIALANELAVICEKAGTNVWDVIALANRHPRVNILNPGPGVGGHCIAVDPWFIASAYRSEAQLIRAARVRNDGMPALVVETIASLVQGIANPRIACLGASYKGNTGDARNSPALEVYSMLVSRPGAAWSVAITDTHVTGSSLPLVSLENALDEASVVVVLTEHQEFRTLDPHEAAKRAKHRVVLDTRNVLDHGKWRAAGFQVHVLGDGKLPR
jgi:UDP-N-acetyl-D-mannosaminuronic acid dehydrogenase